MAGGVLLVGWTVAFLSSVTSGSVSCPYLLESCSFLFQIQDFWFLESVVFQKLLRDESPFCSSSAQICVNAFPRGLGMGESRLAGLMVKEPSRFPVYPALS